MAQRRTKEEKEQATKRRLSQLEYQWEAVKAEGEEHELKLQTENSSSDSNRESNLLVYSQQLIMSDLFRTAWATTLVFMILVGLYFKL